VDAPSGTTSNTKAGRKSGACWRFHVQGIHFTIPMQYMQRETKKRWVDICTETAIVEDPDRLLELTREIIHILAEEERRLTQQPSEWADHSVIEKKKPPEIAVTRRSA